ncbi:hypothetical protein L7F22_060599 [Adiantum nelumboides]|nr:hypothetical protein [Adiantum nelumboides]
MAAVLPVPEQPEEQGVNIIKLEEPEELNVMPTIKRTRAQERDEEMKSDTSKDPKKGNKKIKEAEFESNKKKKSRCPQRVIGIDDFPLGVDVIQHHIELKLDSKPVAQKLRRLGVVQQEALLTEVKEKKITPKTQGKLNFSPQDELEDAYTLLFDGAYRRQRNKAAGGFFILNEEKKEVLKKGIQLHLARSNNEAEYATLKAGLEECKSMGIKRLMVKGDALLIVRQVQETWACKNSKLLQWLHDVKLLMKDFEAIQNQHISRQHNKEVDNMANTQFEVMVGTIRFKEPLFQGQETMEDILYFLETNECPKHLERVQQHCLVRKALNYQLIGEHLLHKGKELVLKRVPLIKEIEKTLMSCHDGVCGGHFAQEITSWKILQAGFVWPFLHRDVQHWCRACKACQQAGFRAGVLDALLENLSIRHVHSRPYYPQCNGLVEKTNGVLCRPQDWDKHLTVALWAYRTSYKVSTQFTPYHLVYGQEALLPIEVKLGSLRVLAKDSISSKEKLEQRILDFQISELDREASIDYYIAQANKKREQFNNKFKEKKLEEGMWSRDMIAC